MLITDRPCASRNSPWPGQVRESDLQSQWRSSSRQFVSLILCNAPAGYARLTSQVIKLYDIVKTVLLEALSERGFLVIAVLAKKPACGLQVLRDLCT